VPNGAVISVRGAASAAALLHLPETAINPLVNAPGDTTTPFGTRHAVVFVQTASSEAPRHEPRRVVAGASDGARTEIVSGLKPGETVKLVSVVRFREKQASDEAKMRQGGDQ
jgi:multidrug efflux pump subunit AcrA (membrane-fusion protein)